MKLGSIGVIFLIAFLVIVIIDDMTLKEGQTFKYEGVLVDTENVEQTYEGSQHQLIKNTFINFSYQIDDGSLPSTLYFESNQYAPSSAIPKGSFIKGEGKILELPKTDDGRKIVVVRGFTLEKPY